MKLTITSLIAVAAALIMAAPLKAQSLQEVTAEGNKVYVEIVDEFAGTDDAFPKDEWEDVTNYSAVINQSLVAIGYSVYHEITFRK